MSRTVPVLLTSLRGWRGSRVKAALDLLSDSDRDVLLLAAWEGLTTVELASALQVTPAAARVRLHRARTRFAEALHTVEEQ